MFILCIGDDGFLYPGKDDILRMYEELKVAGALMDKTETFSNVLSVGQKLFGQFRNPSEDDKLKGIAIAIAQGHYFSDGNKRLATQCLKFFLTVNHLEMRNDASLRAIVNNALAELEQSSDS